MTDLAKPPSTEIADLVSRAAYYGKSVIGDRARACRRKRSSRRRAIVATTCPVCRGEKDPAKLLLESLCEKHYAEVKVPTEEEMREALEQGRRDAAAACD
jgi:hypothetical protein